MAVLVAISYVIVEPDARGVTKAAELAFATWPAAVVLFECIYFLPLTIYFHSLVRKCARCRPLADDDADALDVESCLEHFRWLHRLASRLWGHDYPELVKACRNARQRSRETSEVDAEADKRKA